MNCQNKLVFKVGPFSHSRHLCFAKCPRKHYNMKLYPVQREMTCAQDGKNLSMYAELPASVVVSDISTRRSSVLLFFRKVREGETSVHAFLHDQFCNSSKNYKKLVGV